MLETERASRVLSRDQDVHYVKGNSVGVMAPVYSAPRFLICQQCNNLLMGQSLRSVVFIEYTTPKRGSMQKRYKLQYFNSKLQSHLSQVSPYTKGHNNFLRI